MPTSLTGKQKWLLEDEGVPYVDGTPLTGKQKWLLEDEGVPYVDGTPLTGKQKWLLEDEGVPYVEAEPAETPEEGDPSVWGPEQKRLLAGIYGQRGKFGRRSRRVAVETAIEAAQVAPDVAEAKKPLMEMGKEWEEAREATKEAKESPTGSVKQQALEGLLGTLMFVDQYTLRPYRSAARATNESVKNLLRTDAQIAEAPSWAEIFSQQQEENFGGTEEMMQYGRDLLQTAEILSSPDDYDIASIEELYDDIADHTVKPMQEGLTKFGYAVTAAVTPSNWGLLMGSRGAAAIRAQKQASYAAQERLDHYEQAMEKQEEAKVLARRADVIAKIAGTEPSLESLVAPAAASAEEANYRATAVIADTMLGARDLLGLVVGVFGDPTSEGLGQLASKVRGLARSGVVVSEKGAALYDEALKEVGDEAAKTATREFSAALGDAELALERATKLQDEAAEGMYVWRGDPDKAVAPLAPVYEQRFVEATKAVTEAEDVLNALQQQGMDAAVREARRAAEAGVSDALVDLAGVAARTESPLDGTLLIRNWDDAQTTWKAVEKGDQTFEEFIGEGLRKARENGDVLASIRKGEDGLPEHVFLSADDAVDTPMLRGVDSVRQPIASTVLKGGRKALDELTQAVGGIPVAGKALAKTYDNARNLLALRRTPPISGGTEDAFRVLQRSERLTPGEFQRFRRNLKKARSKAAVVESRANAIHAEIRRVLPAAEADRAAVLALADLTPEQARLSGAAAELQRISREVRRIRDPGGAAPVEATGMSADYMADQAMADILRSLARVVSRDGDDEIMQTMASSIQDVFRTIDRGDRTVDRATIAEQRIAAAQKLADLSQDIQARVMADIVNRGLANAGPDVDVGAFTQIQVENYLRAMSDEYRAETGSVAQLGEDVVSMQAQSQELGMQIRALQGHLDEAKSTGVLGGDVDTQVLIGKYEGLPAMQDEVDALRREQVVLDARLKRKVQEYTAARETVADPTAFDLWGRTYEYARQNVRAIAADRKVSELAALRAALGETDFTNAVKLGLTRAMPGMQHVPSAQRAQMVATAEWVRKTLQSYAKRLQDAGVVDGDPVLSEVVGGVGVTRMLDRITAETQDLRKATLTGSPIEVSPTSVIDPSIGRGLDEIGKDNRELAIAMMERSMLAEVAEEAASAERIGYQDFDISSRALYADVRARATKAVDDLIASGETPTALVMDPAYLVSEALKRGEGAIINAKFIEDLTTRYPAMEEIKNLRAQGMDESIIAGRAKLLGLEKSQYQAAGAPVYLPSGIRSTYDWLYGPRPKIEGIPGELLQAYDQWLSWAKTQLTIGRTLLGYTGVNIAGNILTTMQELGRDALSPRAQAMGVLASLGKGADTPIKLGDYTMTPVEFRQWALESGVIEPPGMSAYQLEEGLVAQPTTKLQEFLRPGDTPPRVPTMDELYPTPVLDRVLPVIDKVIKADRGTKPTRNVLDRTGLALVGAGIGGTAGGVPGAAAGALLGALGAPGMLRLSGELNQAVESQARLATAASALRSGKTLDEAAAIVDDVLRDYGDMLPIERDVLRRLFYFWTWRGGNIRYQLDWLSRNAWEAATVGKVMNAIMTGEPSVDDTTGLPDWLAHKLVVQVRTASGLKMFRKSMVSTDEAYARVRAADYQARKTAADLDRFVAMMADRGKAGTPTQPLLARELAAAKQKLESAKQEAEDELWLAKNDLKLAKKAARIADLKSRRNIVAPELPIADPMKMVQAGLKGGKEAEEEFLSSLGPWSTLISWVWGTDPKRGGSHSPKSLSGMAYAGKIGLTLDQVEDAYPKAFVEGFLGVRGVSGVGGQRKLRTPEGSVVHAEDGSVAKVPTYTTAAPRRWWLVQQLPPWVVLQGYYRIINEPWRAEEFGEPPSTLTRGLTQAAGVKILQAKAASELVRGRQWRIEQAILEEGVRAGYLRPDYKVTDKNFNDLPDTTTDKSAPEPPASKD